MKKHAIYGCFLSVFVLVLPCVMASEPQDAEVAKDVIRSSGPNMIGRIFDAQGEERTYENLSFSGCNLEGSQWDSFLTFKRCNFRGANLRNARLESNFVDCDFTDAIVDGIPSQSLSPEQLKTTKTYREMIFASIPRNGQKNVELRSGADLTGCNLSHLNVEVSTEFGILSNVCFDGCNMTGAFFDDRIVFENCSFQRTRLNDAQIGNIEGCDFTDAVIEGAKISDISRDQLISTLSYKSRNLSRVTLKLRGISLQNFDLHDAVLHLDATCDLTGADISGCNLRFIEKNSQISAQAFPWRMIQSTKSYKEGTLKGLTFDGNVDWSDMDLSRFNLSDAVLGGRWDGANFADSVITGADCRYLTLEQIKQTWNYKNGHMKGIIVSDEVKSALNAEKAAMDATKPADATAADAAADIPEIAE